MDLSCDIFEIFPISVRENILPGEDSILSNIFFSEQNIKVLQDTIRYDVYKRTNFVIDKQSE